MRYVAPCLPVLLHTQIMSIVDMHQMVGCHA